LDGSYPLGIFCSLRSTRSRLSMCSRGPARCRGDVRKRTERVELEASRRDRDRISLNTPRARRAWPCGGSRGAAAVVALKTRGDR
jgi:hypothetical protein